MPASRLIHSTAHELSSYFEPVEEEFVNDFPLKPAAVLALVLASSEFEDDPALVLIERSSELRHHAGQLAFPGGKPEKEDQNLLETALRESEEEVGAPRSEIEILGRLNPVPTPTGFVIVPFVGRCFSEWTPKPQDSEVGSVLLTPLSQLLDPSIHRVTGKRHYRGIDYHLHEYAIHEPPLWGATARMVWELMSRLRGESV